MMMGAPSARLGERVPELRVQRGGDECLLWVRLQKPREVRAPAHRRSEGGRYLDQPLKLFRTPGWLALDHRGVFDLEGQWGALSCLAAHCRLGCCPAVGAVSSARLPNWVLHSLWELLQEGLSCLSVVHELDVYRTCLENSTCCAVAHLLHDEFARSVVQVAGEGILYLPGVFSDADHHSPAAAQVILAPSAIHVDVECARRDHSVSWAVRWSLFPRL